LPPNEVEPDVIQHPLGQAASAVAFDHQNRWMTVSWDDSIEFYPIKKKMPFVFKANGGGSSDIRFTPDVKSIIDGFDNEGLRVWSVPGETQIPSPIVWKLPVTFGFSTYFDLNPIPNLCF
jgi:hypothetical protein